MSISENDPKKIRFSSEVEESRIPVVEPKSEKYSPMPYVFRLPDIGFNHSVYAAAKSPPFAIQLDHAIAVVWSLFSSEHTDVPLGINQLQWAYNFLSEIRTRGGIHRPDVQHCLNVISDELIEQYAEIFEDVNKTRIDETAPPVEEDFGKPLANSSLKDIESTCVCKPRATSAERLNKSDPREHFDFSMTYQDVRSQKRYTPEQEHEETGNAGESNVNIMLNDWRKKQMKTILAELDRLHSIENYISKHGKPVDVMTDDELDEYLCKVCEQSNKDSRKRS